MVFKNFIKYKWVVGSAHDQDFAHLLMSIQDEDGKYQLAENEVVAIKEELIGLMISVPANIQSQLGETISLIADSDFWVRWDTLVDVSRSRIAYFRM